MVFFSKLINVLDALGTIVLWKALEHFSEDNRNAKRSDR